MTEGEIIRKVEVPLALPTIFGGVQLSAVAVVATATIAPLGNVDSLGNLIIEPQTYGLPGQIGAAIAIALITLAIDGGLGAAAAASDTAGLKVGARGEETSLETSFPVNSPENGDLEQSLTTRRTGAPRSVRARPRRCRVRRRRGRGGSGSGDPGCPGRRQPPGQLIESRPANKGKSITIGSKNFPEQYILGEIYRRRWRGGLRREEGSSTWAPSRWRSRRSRAAPVDAYPEYRARR